MTDEEIKQDRAVIEAATEGPWEDRDVGGNRCDCGYEINWETARRLDKDPTND